MLTIITEESTNDGANPDDSFMFQVDELDDYFQTAYEIAHTIGIHKAPMTVSTIVRIYSGQLTQIFQRRH
jgi:hypothetical protein